MIPDRKGLHDVMFVGSTEYVKIDIKQIWQDSYGNILWVEAVDGAVYNWSNVIVMRKSRA